MEKATYFPGEVFTKRHEVENKLLNKNMTFIKVLNHFFFQKFGIILSIVNYLYTTIIYLVT